MALADAGWPEGQQVGALFLGWQSLLACSVLECGEISCWIAAKAGAQGSGETPRLKALAEVAPSFSADPAE
ncbi:hypothetical protein, partial [Siccirubricoccus deserti]|uniref:hypothetical protein n=1 Tax=Siccirubricoccus deserti TaxID=2013562 RepID=UPI001C96C9DB